MINCKPERPVRRDRIAAAALILATGAQFSLPQTAHAGSSTPYMETSTAHCPNGINCALHYTAVPASSRLDIQMVGCEATGMISGGASTTLNFSNARIFLQTIWNGKTVRLPINSGYSVNQYDGTDYYSELTMTNLNFSVQSGQQARIYLYPWRDYFAKSFNCTISGQMVTLP